jgi:hypothetical protein
MATKRAITAINIAGDGLLSAYFISNPPVGRI